jgi:hypothetical protein
MIEVFINGVRYVFLGDDLTSPEQQAVLFLIEQDEKKREF